MIAVATSSHLLLAQSRATSAPQAARKISTDMTCASELGTGLKTKRRFCDVVITPLASESVTIKIPPHTGSALLQFDLHNRFDISTQPLAPLLFAHQVATVSVVRSPGAPIESAAVMGEIRVAADAYDRVESGTAPGVLKAVAPGQPQSVRMTIPAGVASVAILGVKLAATGPTGATEVFETQGRPIAVVSNVRVDYTPR